MKLHHKRDIDQELVIKAREGSEEAFKDLVGRWHARVYNYALRYSNDRVFAEEIVQMTFMSLYEKLDQLRDTSKFKGWLYRIINNECLTEGRKIKRKKELLISTASFPTVSDKNNPESLYNKKERGEIVLQVLQQIPEEQRKVIIMKEYEGMKFREIAEIIGESENTIKARMYYGLDAMRKILTQYKWTKDLYHG